MHKHHLITGFVLCLTLAACSGTPSTGTQTQSSSKSASGGSVQVVTFNAISSVASPQHGKEVFLSYGALSGISGVAANGVASLHVFEDKTSNVGIQLNIHQPQKGQYYQAWIFKTGAAASSWTSLGQLISPTGDVRFALTSNQTADLRNDTEIRITLESDDGNAAPSGDVVATAKLKSAQR